MDSGASDTMFVSQDAFTDYKLVTPQKGDSAKAENVNFEIISEGNVVQCYQVDGREREYLYLCSPPPNIEHKPSLCECAG